MAGIMVDLFVFFICFRATAHSQYVAVFNKGNITLKLDVDSSVQSYAVYLFPNGRLLPVPVRTSADVNIPEALSYTSYMFDVLPKYANGSSGSITRVRYSNPKLFVFEVNEIVIVVMDLSEKPAGGGYTLVNVDTGRFMFDILGGYDVLNMDNRYSFYDDKNNRIHFNINHVRLADAGHIVAKANDKHLGDIILVVTGEPSKPVVTVNGTLLAGNDVIFYCDAQSTSLPEYYRFKVPLRYNWYVDKAFSILTDKVLRLENIPKGYRGKTVWCMAEENGTLSAESNRVVIDLIYRPDRVVIVPYQEMVKVLENSKVGPFNCVADCNPACNMSWILILKYPNGTFKSNTISTTGYIDLGRVNRTSAGYYRCVATGSGLLSKDKRKTYQQFHLDVLYPTEIKSAFLALSNRKTKAYENDNVILVCEISGNPRPNVTWNGINGDVIAKQQNVGVMMNHTLSRLKCSDTGNYTCTSDNGLGRPEARTVSLSVMCAPRLDPAVKFQSQYGAQINSHVIISVQVITNPKPTLSWQQQSRTTITEAMYTQLNPYTYFIKSGIRISDMEDFGVYVFIIQGQNKNATYNVTITAAGVPSKVENLTVSSVTYNSVNITWAPGFDGGGRQDFRIYISDHSDSWDVYDTVEDPGNRHLLGIEVGNLKPDTSYKYKIESCNKYGCQKETALINVQTKGAPAKESSNGLIGAAVAAGSFILLVVVIVVTVKFMIRNRNETAENQDTNENEGVPEDHPSSYRYEHVPVHDLSKDESEVIQGQGALPPVFAGTSEQMKSSKIHRQGITTHDFKGTRRRDISHYEYEEIKGQDTSHNEYEGIQRPDNEYEGIKIPDNEYEGIQRPEHEYERIKKPANEYDGIERPDNDYEGIERPNNDYEGIERPNNDYEGIQRPDNEYEGIQRPSNDYEGIARPNNEYEGVDRPNNEYERIQRPDKDYEGIERPNNECDGVKKPDNNYEGID